MSRFFPQPPRFGADPVNSVDGVRLGYLNSRLATGAVVTLTDAATIATNAALGSLFRVALGGNRTLGAPTNPADGQRIVYEIKQDATGTRTLTLASGAGGFTFGTDIASVTLSTAANKTDYLSTIYNSPANVWRVWAFVRGY